MDQEDVMTWRRCPSPVDSRHKGPVIQIFDVYMVVGLDKLANKQTS